MIETTKIQEMGSTNTTSIPKIYCKLLNLKKGDTLTWTIDMKTGVLKIKKLKK